MKKTLFPILSITFLLCACGVTSSSQEESSSVEDTSSQETTSNQSSSETSSEKEYTSDPKKEPGYKQQKYLNYIGDINSVWKKYRGEGTTIALIDAGFKATHEDFTFEDGTSKVSNKSASFTTSGNNTTVSVGRNR